VVSTIGSYVIQVYTLPKLRLPTLTWREVAFIYAIWFLVRILNTGLMSAFHAEGKKAK
jgi:hypothetical protein